jgi:hypothetical protein
MAMLAERQASISRVPAGAVSCRPSTVKVTSAMVSYLAPWSWVLTLELCSTEKAEWSRFVESHISRKTSEIPELPVRGTIQRRVCGFL